MGPRKMKQVALKPKMEKNMKVRFQFKRVKAEMAKIRDDQQHKREEDTKISESYGEIKRQFDQLKEEIEVIKKRTGRTDFMVDVICKILIAQEDEDFIEAADLTHLLRICSEIVAKEIANANLDEEEEEEEDEDEDEDEDDP